MPRKKEELNKREKAILKFIEKQIMTDGYPPSVREIGKAVGLSSTATVHGYLARLEEKGYIKKQDKKGRTLRLLKGGSGEAKINIKQRFLYTKRISRSANNRKNNCRRANFSSGKCNRHIPNSNRLCWKFRKLYAYS